MHPVGIALAFLVFWSFVAVGTFLCFSCARNLPTAVRLHMPVPVVLHLLGTLIGIGFVSSGLYAATVVIFR